MMRRPKRLQVAALCHQGTGHARRYLLVTSRGTGRWIIPKGWPIRGLSCSQTAMQEAWEEAGVTDGDATPNPMARYTYHKRKEFGLGVPVETLVYSVAVKQMSDNFPEAHERKLIWVKPETAATMVDEPELQRIFLRESELLKS
jgi:8-oxo-dGTP pyrophosphatase MutT (NUDIX family)